MRHLLLLPALLWLAACGGDPKDTDPDESTTDTDTTPTGTPGTTDTDTTTTVPDDDRDDDGSPDDADCAPDDAAIFPGATDAFGDGLDQDCDGADGVDADADGVASAASGGGDCDDASPVISPLATDIAGDAVDQNCDGVDGTDVDGDGAASAASGGDDCDDLAPDTLPGAPDALGDGIDQSCDGIDGFDADLDGHASADSGGDDCDDLAPDTWAGAPDALGDGIDQSCDGIDGFDADLDGVAGVDSGGADCADADPTVYPGAHDAVGDGLDLDCDGHDGIDADHDGDASVQSGGRDCDDGDPLLDGLDADADGAASCAGDCDDADPARSPRLDDVCNGIDDDCDGAVDADAAVADVCLREEVAVAGAGALDVLIVMDDSGSMSAKQGLFAAGADDLLGPLLGSTDLHVGVVTTDMQDATKSGRLQAGPDGALWLDDSYPQGTANSWLANTAQPGIFGTGNEAGLDASYVALELLDASFNAGFTRPEADLAVIFVSDEEDITSVTSPTAWDAWMQGYRPDRTVTVHAFAGGPVSCGANWVSWGRQYLDLAALWGGAQVSICDVDWQADLAGIGAQILPDPNNVFPLAAIPDPATLSVVVTEPDGTVVLPALGADYTWDAAQNALIFAGYVPVADAELAITYRLAY